MIAAIAALMPECLWNHEDLIGPRIFCFAAGRVAAYVDVSPFRMKGLKTYPGLPGTALAVGNMGSVAEEVIGEGEELVPTRLPLHGR